MNDELCQNCGDNLENYDMTYNCDSCGAICCPDCVEFGIDEGEDVENETWCEDCVSGL